jgi:hypothetical protein
VDKVAARAKPFIMIEVSTRKIGIRATFSFTLSQSMALNMCAYIFTGLLFDYRVLAAPFLFMLLIYKI